MRKKNNKILGLNREKIFQNFRHSNQKATRPPSQVTVELNPKLYSDHSMFELCCFTAEKSVIKVKIHIHIIK